MMLRATPTTRVHGRRRGFSLAEVLLALAILGVGLISIAALFPAGIAQQRRSQDALFGPIVAASALDIIRSKTSENDFGRYEDFFWTNPLFTKPGDFPWSRPGHWFEDEVIDGWTIPAGSADLFWAADSGLREIPHNPALYGAENDPDRPHIIVTQRERYYPMVNSLGLDDSNVSTPTDEELRPQYVWDFMVRRFDGRMKVAIFVYRVSSATENEDFNNQWVIQQPLPQFVRLGAGQEWSAPDVDNPSTPEPPVITALPNTDGDWQPWHADGQWYLDQNNNVYRVARGRRTDQDAGVLLSELIRSVPNAPAYFTNANQQEFDDGEPYLETNVVTWIWYVPPVDDRGVRLTPVYVTVEDL